jgi:alpha-galactosidase
MKNSCEVLRVAALIGVLVWSSGVGRAEVTSATHGSDVVIENQFVSVHYHMRTGRMDVAWRDGHKLLDLESGTELANGRSLTTSAYSTHILEKQSPAAPAHGAITVELMPAESKLLELHRGE